MDQHPIPRQITTFEFKLIGFMTLKQFLYLAVFFPIGFIVYKLIPIPIINIVFGVIVAGAGALFAFVPIQDRPLDIWIKNFIKRLNSPTQYVYKKKNNPMDFMKDLYYASDPHVVLSHVESREKLAEYLQRQQQEAKLPPQQEKQRRHVHSLLQQETPHKTVQQIAHAANTKQYSQPTISADMGNLEEGIKQPFVTGIVKNRKQIPIPGILVTIKDKQNNELRILKTNPHGVFATYSPLPVGDYLFEIQDPNGGYFFDTMNVHIDPDNQSPLVFYSKEIL